MVDVAVSVIVIAAVGRRVRVVVGLADSAATVDSRREGASLAPPRRNICVPVKF